MMDMVWDLLCETPTERIVSTQEFPVLYGTGRDHINKRWTTLEIDDILSPKDTFHDLQAVVLDREYLEGQATWLHSARDT